MSIWSPALKLVSAKSVTTAQGQTHTLLTGVMVRSSQAHTSSPRSSVRYCYFRGNTREKHSVMLRCQAWIQLDRDTFYFMFWILINTVKMEATRKDPMLFCLVIDKGAILVHIWFLSFQKVLTCTHILIWTSINKYYLGLNKVQRSTLGYSFTVLGYLFSEKVWSKTFSDLLLFIQAFLLAFFKTIET